MIQKHHLTLLLIAISLLTTTIACSNGEGENETGQLTLNDTASVRLERNHINAGNDFFNDKKLDEAEIEYRKALEANPSSPVATFNLATVLFKMDVEKNADSDKAINTAKADSLLAELKGAPDVLMGFAHYDRGNVRYLLEQWQEAIEFYKEALRKNPNDKWAQYNLRMAQLKLREQQQQQNQGGGGGSGDNDQQDKQDQQQQQDQQQSPQNQEQNNSDKSQSQQQDAKQEQGQPQQNSEQALNAVQQKENATKRQVEQRRSEQNRERQEQTRKKW